MLCGSSRRAVSAFSWAGGWLLLASMMAGCGGGGAVGPAAPQFKGDTVPITGTVTLDGNPLSDASVNFIFFENPPQGFISSGGKTDSSGKYVVRSVGGKEGTPPGRYRVTISCMVTKDGSPFKEDPASGMDAEQLRMAGGLKELVPAKYSDPGKSQLTVEVTSTQKDPVDFALKSK